MKLKTDDWFFLLGLVLVVGLIVAKYDAQYLVALVLGHKGVSVIDDKFSDKIQGTQNGKLLD